MPWAIPGTTHPHLRVVTGGLIVFQGRKQLQIEAELNDVRSFMDDSALSADLHDYRLANGYGVKIVEPLKRYRMTYADASRQNSVAIEYEALMPPVMFADGNHFEQALRAKGELVLRGTRFDLPPEKTVLGGWIQRDGKSGFVVKGSKRIERDATTLLPKSATFEIEDDIGRRFTVRGTVVAACPYQVWPNIYFPLCLARWECEGMVAYGDLQEGMWTDYVNFLRQR